MRDSKVYSVGYITRSSSYLRLQLGKDVLHSFLRGWWRTRSTFDGLVHRKASSGIGIQNGMHSARMPTCPPSRQLRNLSISNAA
jgi:hypothetical protein